MINVHLFGELRKYSKYKKMTDDSKIIMEHIENETIDDLIKRIGISEDFGDVFINHKVVTTDAIIPDEARIAIFGRGMFLLCGGQHLKGNGYITRKPASEFNYWNKD